MKNNITIVLLVLFTVSVSFAQKNEREIINKRITLTQQKKEIDKTVIRSLNAITTATLYDFTTGSDKFYGGSYGAIEIESGVWGMIAADGNSDGSVDAQDYNLYKNGQGNEGYESADYNLDGGNYAEDYTLYKDNQGKETAVPN